MKGRFTRYNHGRQARTKDKHPARALYPVYPGVTPAEQERIAVDIVPAGPWSPWIGHRTLVFPREQTTSHLVTGGLKWASRTAAGVTN